MKILLIAAVSVVVVLGIGVAAVMLIGYSLPAKHTASRTIRIGRPVSEVFQTVRRFTEHPSWRPGIERIEMLPDEDGRTRFREHGRHDTITYELSEEVPERRMVTTIVDRDLGYSGSWTYTFDGEGEGTVLTITEDGEVSNPVFRFMSRYVFGHTATIDAYLEALARHFGEGAKPA